MLGFSHLFYPWGFLLQIAALVHFVKRRPENYWLWIILIGGPIGAGAYLLVEAVPDARLLGGVFPGIWTTLQNSKARDGNTRQSVCRKL